MSTHLLIHVDPGCTFKCHCMMTRTHTHTAFKRELEVSSVLQHAENLEHLNIAASYLWPWILCCKCNDENDPILVVRKRKDEPRLSELFIVLATISSLKVALIHYVLWYVRVSPSCVVVWTALVLHAIKCWIFNSLRGFRVSAVSDHCLLSI